MKNGKKSLVIRIVIPMKLTLEQTCMLFLVMSSNKTGDSQPHTKEGKILDMVEQL